MIDKTVEIGGKEPNGKPACIGRWTFQTRKVREELLDKLHGRVLNACAGQTHLSKNGIDVVRNDLNPDIEADYHVDITDIDTVFDDHSFDVVVLDPPFDQTQSDELYDGLHARDVGTARKKLAALVKPGGSIVEFGWSTWSSSDYFQSYENDCTVHFKRAIPERRPVFMTADRLTQTTLEAVGYD